MSRLFWSIIREDRNPCCSSGRSFCFLTPTSGASEGRGSSTKTSTRDWTELKLTLEAKAFVASETTGMIEVGAGDGAGGGGTTGVG